MCSENILQNWGEIKIFSNEGKLPELDYPERVPEGSSLNIKEMIKEENLKNQERTTESEGKLQGSK